MKINIFKVIIFIIYFCIFLFFLSYYSVLLNMKRVPRWTEKDWKSARTMVALTRTPVAKLADVPALTTSALSNEYSFVSAHTTSKPVMGLKKKEK